MKLKERERTVVNERSDEVVAGPLALRVVSLGKGVPSSLVGSGHGGDVVVLDW